MVYDNLKVKEHLLIIFFLGGLVALIDSGRFTVGGFLGGGIGMIVLGMGIGFAVNFILKKIRNYNQSVKSAKMIDSKFSDEKLTTDDRMKYKLKPYKYGVYFALFFLLLALLNLILRYV